MLCLNDSIRHDDSCVQHALRALDEALTLTEVLLAAWALARVVTMHVVETVLAARARHPHTWPACPSCGASLWSKGFVTRQVTSLFGPIRWQRRVGRCPQGKRCRIVKDVFRHTKEKYDDLVMEIACGLHNFRVHCRES